MTWNHFITLEHSWFVKPFSLFLLSLHWIVYQQECDKIYVCGFPIDRRNLGQYWTGGQVRKHAECLVLLQMLRCSAGSAYSCTILTQLQPASSNLLYFFHTTAYLLTPWSRVLLDKLTGSAASQEIPRIYGTRRFITVLTSARHLSLSWANSIQSPKPPPTSWRSILILSSLLRLCLPSGLFPSGFHTTATRSI